MPGKSIAQKLFLKPGKRLALAGAPREVAALIAPLPEGARLVRSGDADLVLGFVRSQRDLERDLPGLGKRVADGGALWLAYPKLTSKLAGDIHRDTIHAYARKQGWEGVSMIALDGDWSAMRFKRV
jgi:hypothetical protein